MKSADDAMQTILRGLRDVQVPEGMEQRIVKGLDERVVPGAASGLDWLRSPAAWGLSAAGVCALLLVVFGMYRMNLNSIHADKIAVRTTRSQGSQPSVVHEKVEAPQEVLLPVAATKPRTRQTVQQAEMRQATTARKSETASLDDATARSFPAPPMPLTEQERLLLKMAHRSDPELIAMLNPAARAGREAEEQAEVAKFFEEKKRGESE